MTKKLMVSLLATVLCFGLLLPGCSLLSVIKAPDAFTDILGHEAEGELTLLAALGVLDEADGVGGPANPDGTISRAEFVELIITAWGKANMAGALAGLRPNFVDEISTQYWGYVNVADYMGVLNGFEDATFRADDPLTYADAITMLVRVVSGHAAQVTPIAPWPYDYIFYGVDNGFNGDVDVSFAGVPCTFGDAARMVVAALQINQLSPQGAVVDDSAILYDKVVEGDMDLEHEGNLYHGVLLAGEIALAAAGADGEGAGTLHMYYPEYPAWFTVSFSDPVHLVGSLDDVPGAESLNGLEVVLVTNDDNEVLFIEKVAEVNVVTGVYEDMILGEGDEITSLSEGDPEDDLLVLADGTEIPIRAWGRDQDGAWLMLNGVSGLPHDALEDLEELWEGDAGADISFLAPELTVFVDESGYGVSILATLFTAPLWVFEMTPSGIDAAGQAYDTELVLYYPSAEPYPFPVRETCAVTINGAAADRDELAKYDVVSMALVFNDTIEEGVVSAEDDDVVPYIIRAHREVVEGTVAATAIHYPGEVLEATIEFADETTATYTVNPYGGIGFDYPPPGISGLTEVVRYGLDFNGDIFVPIGYETLTPYALLLSYTEFGDGSYQATFDIRGEETTYAVAPNDPEAPDSPLFDGPDGPVALDELVGLYVYIEVATGTSTVDPDNSYYFHPEWSTTYDVLAVDAENGTMTVYCYGCSQVEFVIDADLVIYDEDGNCIGLEGIAVDDELDGFYCSYGDPVFTLDEDD